VHSLPVRSSMALYEPSTLPVRSSMALYGPSALTSSTLGLANPTFLEPFWVLGISDINI
jgi:hypothetical protein